MDTLKRDYRSFDFLLALLVLAVAIFGIIIIGSATHVTLGGDIYDFTDSQKFWVVSGVAIMLLTAFVDYHFVCKFFIPIYVINISLLVLVYFLGRDDSSGTARWLRFGGFGIQPSEFCKIFMIVFLARFMEKYSEYINKPWVLILTLALIALPAALIIIQPSLSAALVVGVLSLTILFAAKLSYKYIVPVIAVTVPAILGIFFDLRRESPVIVDKILTSYQIERLMLWINPDEADPKYYQTMQSIRAIGSGQFSGKGLNLGDTSLPMAHNDFIFAIIGEELGFIGCMAVLGIMMFIVLKCLLIAYKAADLSGRLIATGVGSMLAFQTFVNIGVAAGVLPNTGTSLPFISYGGSSMWVSMASIGFCINVAMTRQKSFFET